MGGQEKALKRSSNKLPEEKIVLSEDYLKNSKVSMFGKYISEDNDQGIAARNKKYWIKKAENVSQQELNDILIASLGGPLQDFMRDAQYIAHDFNNEKVYKEITKLPSDNSTEDASKSKRNLHFYNKLANSEFKDFIEAICLYHVQNPAASAVRYGIENAFSNYTFNDKYFFERAIESSESQASVPKKTMSFLIKNEKLTARGSLKLLLKDNNFKVKNLFENNEVTAECQLKQDEDIPDMKYWKLTKLESNNPFLLLAVLSSTFPLPLLNLLEENNLLKKQLDKLEQLQVDPGYLDKIKTRRLELITQIQNDVRNQFNNNINADEITLNKTLIKEFHDFATPHLMLTRLEVELSEICEFNFPTSNRDAHLRKVNLQKELLNFKNTVIPNLENKLAELLQSNPETALEKLAKDRDYIIWQNFTKSLQKELLKINSLTREIDNLDNKSKTLRGTEKQNALNEKNRKKEQRVALSKKILEKLQEMLSNIKELKEIDQDILTFGKILKKEQINVDSSIREFHQNSIDDFKRNQYQDDDPESVNQNLKKLIESSARFSKDLEKKKYKSNSINGLIHFFYAESSTNKEQTHKERFQGWIKDLMETQDDDSVGSIYTQKRIIRQMIKDAFTMQENLNKDDKISQAEKNSLNQMYHKLIQHSKATEKEIDQKIYFTPILRKYNNGEKILKNIENHGQTSGELKARKQIESILTSSEANSIAKKLTAISRIINQNKPNAAFEFFGIFKNETARYNQLKAEAFLYVLLDAAKKGETNIEGLCEILNNLIEMMPEEKLFIDLKINILKIHADIEAHFIAFNENNNFVKGSAKEKVLRTFKNELIDNIVEANQAPENSQKTDQTRLTDMRTTLTKLNEVAGEKNKEDLHKKMATPIFDLLKKSSQNTPAYTARRGKHNMWSNLSQGRERAF